MNRIPLCPPWIYKDEKLWFDWLAYLDKIEHTKQDEPLPITWPLGKTFREAFFPDKPEPYKGPKRNGIIGLMGDPTYIFTHHTGDQAKEGEINERRNPNV